MRASAAIVGSGNIGTDLLHKLLRSPWVEPLYMVGIDPQSEGLSRARAAGLEVSSEGVDWLLSRPTLPQLVFEATSARVHSAAAGSYEAAGIRAIDLTPAAIGPYVVPTANLEENLNEPNLNMVTCGGQATIPIVKAVSRVVPVPYAEIVASISSSSAGPGTRANIDEFTETTSRAIEVVGGAERGKAIVVLNPADPPVVMRDTVICRIGEDADVDAIAASIVETVSQVQGYVPGYRMSAPPQFADDRVVVLLEVEGAGDYFPAFAGNLDIMTAAATRVGEAVARSMVESVR